ncbi:GNAT family N-acetyltransferase [Stygiolobus caldivivus]|uniref:GCN5 family acetyltransferase n=1 Tax=Stygiolobus caldivivus TaxID=2824673 RepID=A0A8D5U7G2_9CREN|nr:GNAT family N-acetyltransferase [Stygiolobus caldivivus]BCU70729.1 GCN5 family acetyltransferase [Stygiolobus caldivivus]
MNEYPRPYKTIQTPLGDCNIYTIQSSFLDKFKRFDCGEEEQNDFIRRLAVGHYLAGINHTFLLVCGNDLVGFVSFSSYSFEFTGEAKNEMISGLKEEFTNRGLPHEIEISFKKLPVLLLGQLGIDKKYQGKGIGSALVKRFVIPYSLNYCIENSCIGLLVYTRTAKDFYEKLGFEKIYESKRGTNYFYSLYKNVLRARQDAFSSK